MNKEKAISPAELVVMKVIWKEQSCTASVIVDKISLESAWHFRTIKTLLRNLVSKELVGYTVDERDSRIYHYYPLIKEEDYLRRERKQFLETFYNGNMGNMLVGFLKDSRISKSEAQELRNLLNECSGDGKDGGRE
jgi:BlaI family transcriptional regulator, penicillinase repressor